jgi:hypothetical protein
MRDVPQRGDPLRVSSSVSGKKHWRSPLPGLSAFGSMHTFPSDPHAVVPLGGGFCSL